MTTVAAPARRKLLERLIDYAGLFPPASLSTKAALAEYRRAEAGEARRLLGRFLCPASRLGELDGEDLRIGLVVDTPELPPLDERVESIETPLSRDSAVLGAGRETFLETDASGVARVAGLGAGAKIRCGGTAVPSAAAVAEFVAACRAHGIRFKATAGLHHAVRNGGAHGFLNLLAAAGLPGRELEALEEDDASAFELGETFTFRGTPVESPRALFVAFGSCSFGEPVDDLRALGLL